MMCAINPKQQKHFTLSVYTSLDMTEQDFLQLVIEKVLNVEQGLNSDGRFRWHIKDDAGLMLAALEALLRQALQSDVNDPANEWGQEAIAMANLIITQMKGERRW